MYFDCCSTIEDDVETAADAPPKLRDSFFFVSSPQNPITGNERGVTGRATVTGARESYLPNRADLSTERGRRVTADGQETKEHIYQTESASIL